MCWRFCRLVIIWLRQQPCLSNVNLCLRTMKWMVRVNLLASSEFSLTSEQELAVRAFVEGEDVLAVLPTGYTVVTERALSIKCSFVPEDYELDGKVTIFMIFPLISIIEDQISEMKSLGYSTILVASIVWNAGMHQMLA